MSSTGLITPPGVSNRVRPCRAKSGMSLLNDIYIYLKKSEHPPRCVAPHKQGHLIGRNLDLDLRGEVTP